MIIELISKKRTKRQKKEKQNLLKYRWIDNFSVNVSIILSNIWWGDDHVGEGVKLACGWHTEVSDTTPDRKVNRKPKAPRTCHARYNEIYSPSFNPGGYASNSMQLIATEKTGKSAWFKVIT